MYYFAEGISKTRAELAQQPVLHKTTRNAGHVSDAIEPNSTRFWAGVNFGQLADEFIGVLSAEGFRIVREWWTSPPETGRIWGCVDVVPHAVTHVKLDIGQPSWLSLGFKTAHNGLESIQGFMGVRCAVNGVGFMSKGQCFKAKQTLNFDMTYQTGLMVERVKYDWPVLQAQVNNLQSRHLTNGEAALTLIRVAEENALPRTAFWDAWKLWRKPLHKEFAEPTAWSLYHAAAERAKILEPAVQHKFYSTVYQLIMDDSCRS